MTVKTMIAFCGLDCSECEAFKATAAGDKEALAELARRWGEQQGAHYTPEALACGGCQSDKLNAYCNKCAVRKCAKDRGHTTCADCGSYICEKLENEWKSWHEASWEQAKGNLDKIR